MSITIRFDVDWIKDQTDFNHAFNEVFFICEEEDYLHRAVWTSEFIKTCIDVIGGKQTFKYLSEYTIDLLKSEHRSVYHHILTMIKILKWSKPIEYIDNNNIGHSRKETIKLIKLIMNNHYFYDEIMIKDELLGFVEEVYDDDCIIDDEYDFIIDDVESTIDDKSWFKDYINQIRKIKVENKKNVNN